MTVAIATAEMFPKMATNSPFSSDMMLFFVQAAAYLQEIQYALVLKNIYTHTGFTWVNNNFHIPEYGNHGYQGCIHWNYADKGLDPNAEENIHISSVIMV